MQNYNKVGIKFNGRHSTDFGLILLKGKEIGFPEKNKIEVRVPFSNAVIDLSNIYGSQTFGERSIKHVFLIRDFKNKDAESMYRLWTKVVNWLTQPTTKQPMYDDIMHKYYYLAEVVKAPSLEDMVSTGKLTVEWTCYPFRIYELFEGHDIWDDFDFEFDIAQEIEYEINGSRNIQLFNVGSNVAIPEIITDNALSITIKNQTINLVSGSTKLSRIRLLPGVNDLNVTGTGSIKFNFHKELI